LFSENLTIADDPLDPEFLPFPFDAEGVPKKRFPLIEGGRVGGPAVDKLFSDRLALSLTGSSADLASDEHGIPLHISVSPGVASVDELIAST
ncbi:hypothetical protein GUF29_20875, partial [Xanthomonas citri pv. citri]|nr:hypothetical protein [Xanthomonas citri pv. citri]